MEKPVYQFSGVLKALRAKAGLTVLEAAEATHYPKYERWESGRTRVGTQHLQAIADAFDIADELYLLLFAWLVDRWTPGPGQPPMEVTGATVQRFLAHTPSRTLDLGEFGDLVVKLPTHAEMAVLALAAQYYRPENIERHTVRLVPVDRSHVPKSVAEGSGPVLDTLYGCVLGDIGEYVGRTLMTIGSDPSTEGFRSYPLSNLAPMFSRPESFEEMAEEGRTQALEGPTALEKFAAVTLRQGDELTDLSRQFREHLVSLLEAVSGEPADQAELDRLMASLLSGDLEPLVDLSAKGLDDGVVLPGPDSAFGKRVNALWELVSSGMTQAIREDMAAEVDRAGPMLALQALQYLRSQPPI